MNRYPQNQTTKDSNNKRKINTFIIPVLVTPDDIYIRISGLERLDSLAYKFYNDITAWPIIATANGIGKGTLMIKPGTILRIPKNDNFTDRIFETNNQR